MRQIRYRLLVALAFALMGFNLLQRGGFDESWLSQWRLNLEDVTQDIERIELKYNIIIKHGVAEEAIPDYWLLPPSSATAEPIEKANLNRFIKNLERELEKYPVEVIKQNLSTIYLFKELSFYGVGYGGTSIGNSIYLTGGAIEEGYDNTYMANVFHHELSSIFFRDHPFPKEAWSSINPEEFAYVDSYNEVLAAVTEANESGDNVGSHEEGFVSKYGQSTLENDFNMYAEMIFMDPQKLKSLSEKYPRVRQKYELTKNFYTSMSEDFFTM
ncbi:MAG: hypothetical protein KUG83_06690 [Gammaproteobacteria bacterium]|nr:hypothetical protein [Gammaproteobacteria bacterium]